MTTDRISGREKLDDASMLHSHGDAAGKMVIVRVDRSPTQSVSIEVEAEGQ
jgi:hypothetical protein